jgi:hypothetical protein
LKYEVYLLLPLYVAWPITLAGLFGYSILESVESQATRCDVNQKWSFDPNMETPRNTHMVLMRTPVRILRVWELTRYFMVAIA